MDKLATNARLEAAGLPVAQELARFHPETGTLKSAAEITAFLLDPDNTPLFGKPVHARSTLGVAAVEQSVGDGRVMLGDGRIVRAADLADEIAEHYREGYVFQELLRASDAMRPLSGPVVPTLRVATLMLGGEPVPLYALLRLPAVGAMADDGSAGENARAFLDLKTGAVVRAQNMSRVCGEDLHHAPVTGLAFKGQAVPQWDEVLRLSVEVHRQFPRHTFVGSDIALSSRGLVVNEANAQPHHMSYQMVSGRGILNAGFRPLFRQALAEKGITAPKRRVAWPYE
jgi:glutathione synthase/RimK-type ligase-like ATP-grasp enzyme